MKVCIARNAQVETNASMNRIIDALVSIDNEVIVLSRSRYKNEGLVKKQYKTKYNLIDNYEIQIATEVGRGLLGIFQLLKYQLYTFIWLVKNQKKYDFIHAFDLDVGLPSIIVAKILNKKLIYHIADFYVDSRGGLPRFLKTVIKKIEHLIINNAEATIICTEDRKKQIQGSKPKKLTVVHNVPNIDIKKLNENSENIEDIEKHKGIKFTYVGGLSETRFIKQVLNVFKKNPQFTLVIAGIGNLSDTVKKYAEQYKNIIYYGKVNYIEALDLYRGTDIMFAIYDPKIANHKFAAPNKIYESMAMGKPIIVAKQTGLSNVVKENDMGWLIDYNEEDFETLICKLKNQKESIKVKGQNAKNTYQHFSWNNVRNEIISLYNEI